MQGYAKERGELVVSLAVSHFATTSQYTMLNIRSDAATLDVTPAAQRLVVRNEVVYAAACSGAPRVRAIYIYKYIDRSKIKIIFL